MGNTNLDILRRAGVLQTFDCYLQGLLSRICDLIEEKNYRDAVNVLYSDTNVSDGLKDEVRRVVTKYLLLSVEREWTLHGIWRTFRFWSREEKISYLHKANELLATIQEINRDVVYGFGSVLGFIRDGDFIAHDDDMDLLVAFQPSRVSTFNDGKKLLMDHLSSRGAIVYNENKTHFTANGVDVFVGFVEVTGSVSWFPSARNSGLMYSDVFPGTIINVLGVNVKIPRDPEKYLLVTYGADWRSPDSSWRHPWDLSGYREYLP